MEHSFDPHAIEQALYDEWENANYFAPPGNGPAYCIMIPPPNVTGSCTWATRSRTPSWTR